MAARKKCQKERTPLRAKLQAADSISRITWNGQKGRTSETKKKNQVFQRDSEKGRGGAEWQEAK